jgi:acetyl-CoA synthetase
MGPWEVVGCLALGGTLFLYEGSPDYPGPDRLWAMVERHRISILGVSPTLIRSLERQGAEVVARHDLGSLRVLASTGEPWNPEPWWWLFRQVGGGRCPIINLSGGTEVGACFLSPTPLTPLTPTSLGHPSLGMAVDIVDEAGRPVPPGTVGELVARRPWPGMTRGLWRDPDRYLQTYWSRWPGLWYHGDFASRDEQGNWYLHGRSDDTIKIGGKRVGPAEI